MRETKQRNQVATAPTTASTTSGNTKALANVQSELAELRKMMEIQRKTIDAQHDTIAALKASRGGYFRGIVESCPVQHSRNAPSTESAPITGETANGRGKDAATEAATVAANAVANRLEEQLTAVVGFGAGVGGGGGRQQR